MHDKERPQAAILRAGSPRKPTFLYRMLRSVVAVLTLVFLTENTRSLTVESAETCRDEDLQSPVDITQPLVFKNFQVGLHLRNLTEIPIRKQAKNLFKLETDFGSVDFAGGKFKVDRAFFRFPSEHKINGQRMPLELQMIGTDPQGAKIGLVVLYYAGKNLNYFLNEMSFGKGYLKELPVSSQRDKKLYVAKTNISFDRAFTNNGTWLMYEGSDTNAPCNSITWLISFDVAEVHPEQLMDVPEDSVPYFKTKPLKNRVVYRNKHSEEELLEVIRDQEKRVNHELKKKNEDDIKKEEARKLEALANALEKAMDSESEEVRNARKHLQAEYQKIEDKKVQKKAAVRQKIAKKHTDETLHQRAADLRYPTTLLYERILDKVKNYYKKAPSCPDFLEYEPPKGRPWGYVPPNVVMSWDINKFTNSNTTKVARPTIPSPAEKTLVFRPLFFQQKDTCGEVDALNMSIWAPVPHPDPIPLNSPLLTKLAQIDMMILDQKNKSTSEVRTLIPVLVKTLPNISAPSAPVTSFTMLNGSELIESVPNTTDAIIKLPKEQITKVAPVKLVRDFEVDTQAQKELEARRMKDVNNRLGPNGGYNVPPPKPAGAPPGPVDHPMPNFFNISHPEPGKLVRIWPPFRPEFEEGVMPMDVKYAWNPIPESELVVNLQPPPSPDREFRWIVYCWLEGQYKTGPRDRAPWIPIYVLARSDFQWSKNVIPSEIPTPKNLTYGKDHRLPVSSIILKFEARNVKDMTTEAKLLQPPKKVNPEDAYLPPTRFRLNLDKRLNVENPLYMKALEEKYKSMRGLISDRYEQKLQEGTGILIETDLAWRMEQEELEQQQLEADRQQIMAARQQRLARITGTPGTTIQRTVRYERVCLEHNLEVVVNRRGNNYVEGIYPPVFQICKRWGWREYNETIMIPGTPGIPQPGANNTAPNSPGAPPVPGPAPTVNLEDKAATKEEKCKEYMQIVLNRRRIFLTDPYDDYMQKECVEIFNALKRTRLQHFRGGLGPIMRAVKDTTAKSAQMLKNARDDARRVNQEEAERRYQQGMNKTTTPKQLSPIKQLAQKYPSADK